MDLLEQGFFIDLLEQVFSLTCWCRFIFFIDLLEQVCFFWSRSKHFSVLQSQKLNVGNTGFRFSSPLNNLVQVNDAFGMTLQFLALE